jgi:protein SCO1/2
VKPRFWLAAPLAVLLGSLVVFGVLGGVLGPGRRAWWAGQGQGQGPGQALPVFGTVPSFRLTDQRGQTVTAADLHGRVWVANFMFTSCAGVCPVLTRRMVEVQRWAEHAGYPATALRLVSFSVEPERDTPERLAGFAREHGADAARWSFLTGPYQAVERAAVEGFKQGLSRERPGPGEPPGDGLDGINIFHGTRLVLVDREGRIRGYYEADAEGLGRLEADATQLLSEGPGGVAGAARSSAVDVQGTGRS